MTDTGETQGVPILLPGLLLPLMLLLLLLVMERVERPLLIDSMSEQLEMFLWTASPNEVELFVSEGYGPALEMYWRTRRGRSRLPAGVGPT